MSGGDIVSDSPDSDPVYSSNRVGKGNTSYALFKQPLSGLSTLELRNRTHNYEVGVRTDRREKRQFAGLALAAARYIPKFLVKTIGPIFSSLLGSGKSHIASK